MPMTTQKELARQFAEGADCGTASNMMIVRDDDVTHLVGYGWAIYATRFDDGDIAMYDDAWCEWARERGGRTVQSQFSQIRSGFHAAAMSRHPGNVVKHPTVTHVEGERPTFASPPSSVARVGSTPTR